jgi:hypothetical protein
MSKAKIEDIPIGIRKFLGLQTDQDKKQEKEDKLAKSMNRKCAKNDGYSNYECSREEYLSIYRKGYEAGYKAGKEYRSK